MGQPQSPLIPEPDPLRSSPRRRGPRLFCSGRSDSPESIRPPLTAAARPASVAADSHPATPFGAALQLIGAHAAVLALIALVGAVVVFSLLLGGDALATAWNKPSPAVGYLGFEMVRGTRRLRGQYRRAGLLRLPVLLVGMFVRARANTHADRYAAMSAVAT